MQFYAGPDAYIEVQALDSVELEEIMVGDLEAVVVYGENSHTGNKYIRGILWMQDGSAFYLTGHTALDLIVIAESIK